MKLPQKLPGSFILNRKGSRANDLLIAYHMDCHIDGLKFDVFHSKEIIVKQFLFTDCEIDEDIMFQKKIIQLQKILNPGNSQTLNTNLIDKDELMKAMPEDIKQTAPDSLINQAVLKVDKLQAVKRMQSQRIENIKQ